MLSPPVLAIIVVICLLILIALRVPLAIALGSLGFFGLVYVLGWDSTIDSLKMYPLMKIASWSLLAVPLFVMMGNFAAAAGITENAYALAQRWTGKRLPGSLAIATIGTGAMFASCSGSSPAMVGAMGVVCLPEMLRYGYDKRLASGATCCGALLGPMIPPSIAFVIYGIMTETSIGRLLIAGIIPGILTALVFITGIIIWVKMNPRIAPKAASGITSEKRINVAKAIGPILLLALIIMGGIYSGVFTATEAAGIGAFSALVLGLIRGRKNLPAIGRAISETTGSTSMIFLLLIGSTFLSFFFVMSGITTWFVEFAVALPVSRTIVLILILAMYVALGMVVDSISMMLITLPVVFPAIVALGYNPIWFGVLIVKLNEIALITPPVGMNVYILKAVAPPEISLGDIFYGSFAFLAMEIVTLALLVALPQLSLFLPSLMK